MNQPQLNKYKSFTAKDFAADDDFVRYVCNPNQEDITFWNELIQIFPEKSQAVREAKLLIQALQPDQAMLHPVDAEDLWAALSNKHHEVFISRTTGRKIHTSKLKNVFWGIAAASLLILTGILISNLFKDEETFTYSTGYDQIASVILPDNSMVTLNANSSIKVWSSGLFQKNREIALTGEANFKVKKKKTSGIYHKMLVHTNSGTVEVTGTTFNVYSRENKTKVYLREGKVKLNNLPDLPVIHMHPGDYIQYDVLDKTISKNKVASQIIDSWVFNKVIYDKTPVTEVLNHIKAVHGWGYVLKNKSLKDKSFTGVLPADDLSLLLKALEEAFDIKIIKKDKTLLITFK
ncbi:MAG: FecR domain-containing protein [Saprospiraceae bacterium]|jgi:transmembrane sensor|nr:FecR domain-containing protein [Saprospiraceae bacterium]